MTGEAGHRVMARFDQLREDARSTYRRYLAALRERVMGNQETLPALALAATASVRGSGRRVILVGPGAAYVARTVGSLTGPGAIHLSCAELTESGWRGANVSAYVDGRSLYPGQVIHVAGLETAAVRRGAYRGHTETTQEHREGKQAAIKQLFAGEPIRAGRDGEILIPTEHLLVIATARVDLPDRPNTEWWVEMGYTHGLAEQLASAEVVRLEPLTADETWNVLVNAVAEISADAEDLGAIIDADPESIMRLAEAVATGRASMGEARAWIRSAAQRGILALLSDDPRQGISDRWVVALDDLLPMPGVARTRWME